MALSKRAKSSNKEGRIQFAKQAVKLGQFTSIRAAAASSDVADTTLGYRIRGRRSRDECISNSRKLTSCEEEAIIQYILDLDSRGFPPRPRDVQEMADLLLTARDASPVGKN